jgi:hypothetical protein
VHEADNQHNKLFFLSRPVFQCCLQHVSIQQ